MPKQAKGKTGSTRLRGDDRKFFWVGFGFGFFLGKSARFSGLAVAEADRLRPRLAMYRHRSDDQPSYITFKN